MVKSVLLKHPLKAKHHLFPVQLVLHLVLIVPDRIQLILVQSLREAEEGHSKFLLPLCMMIFQKMELLRKRKGGNHVKMLRSGGTKKTDV